LEVEVTQTARHIDDLADEIEPGDGVRIEGNGAGVSA
jgi:hypothetical protein